MPSTPAYQIVVVDEQLQIISVGIQGPVGPQGPAGPAGGDEVPLAQRVDETAFGTIFIGQASPGAAESAAVWRIKRIVFSDSGKDIAITWADGNENFDNVWNDHLGLTYS